MINIGIAAYNEENNIKETLPFLEKNLGELKIRNKTKVFVCLNGCTDKTEKIIQKIQKKFKNIHILHAKKGKLNAHKKIVENIKENEIILFCDADIFIPKKSISDVIKELKNNQTAQVVSAYPYIIESKKEGFFKKIAYNVLNLKRIHPKIEVAKKDVSKFHGNVRDNFIKKSRIYFHGRFFGVKNKNIYEFPKKGSKIRGDDTFLTRKVLSRFGPGSIKVLYSSPVYCVPLYSLSEYLKTRYRIKKDIEIMEREYPEFKDINKHSEMTLNWDYFKILSPSKKMYALLFYLLKKYENFSYSFLRKQIDLDTIWSYRDKKHWGS